jgi:hypothetical protein
MRLTIEHLRLPSNVAPDVARCGVCTETAEQIGDPFRITESAEERLDASAPDGREEIAEVHFKDDELTDMRLTESLYRAAFAEAMNRIMQGHLI